MIIKEIDYYSHNNLVDLSIFVHRVLKDSVKTFRYFNSRVLACIEEHEVTLLGYGGGLPIAYGHLDLCHISGKIWLGVAVGSDYCSKGYGRKMVEELLNRRTTPVHLTVDIDNTLARHLYEKIGFDLIDTRTKLGTGDIVEYRIGEP